MDEVRKQTSELISGNFRNFSQIGRSKEDACSRTPSNADSTMRVLRRDLENSIDILRTANTQMAALQTENTGLRRALNRIGGIGA